MRAFDEPQPQISSYWSKKLKPSANDENLIRKLTFSIENNFMLQTQTTNVSMGLCWQMPKFIVWCLWSIYFDHHLPLKPSIGKRRSKVVHLINISTFDWVFLSIKIKIKSVTCKFNIKDTMRSKLKYRVLTYIHKIIIMLFYCSNKILKSNISDYL